ncbi:MAG: restriction endonuclease, partial [Planctomycetes bacterium]|nr:restriction endonuclease [Planctomycetota bacterium]
MSQRTRRRGTASSAVRIEGALFSPELLAQIRGGESSIADLKPESYHLPSGQRLGEAMTAAWNEARSLAHRFYAAQAKADPSDPAVQRTRQDWLLPLFQILGYGRLQAAALRDAEGQPIPLSHLWGAVPIHLVGTGVDLDRRTKGVTGAATRAPHALVQELLNERDEYLWGIVSNGKLLRLLRDNASFTRQAYVEFDLQSIFEGESYNDFTLLWLLLHVSSLENPPARDEDGGRPPCRLERWSKQAAEQGTRVREQLREGVKGAIEALGRGFLAHPKNEALRAALATGALTTQDYYRELLRLAYRLIFLFVAEDRDLLLDPTAPDEAQERYREHYATTRLRRRAARTRGTRHDDAWQGLALVMRFLGQDEGCPALALPALGSFLWSEDALPHLAHATLDNAALYEALRKLTTFHDGQRRQLVDWRNLGSEELGSVYESLLELVPEVHRDAATFDLKEVFGSERKTSGSYYTPTSLIACLLESALDPVVDQALQGKRGADAERALLALKVCDPACGSGHFLVAAAHRLAHRLAL